MKDDKSVDRLEEAADAMIIAKSVQEKLTRVIKYLAITKINREGRLNPDDQLAVRILESRQREIERLWLAEFAPEDDPRRITAVQELALINRDTGKLIQLGEKNHGVGRLDCRACDKQDTDQGPQRLARVCTICSNGIQHVYTQKIQTTETPRTGSERGRVVVILGEGLKIEPREPKRQETCFYKPVRTYHCDYCGQIQTQETI